MKTISFIGSDKNAGKTTAFNYALDRFRESGTPTLISSIGINGEESDAFENRPKPGIHLSRNDLFITASEHLKELTGKYEIVRVFSPPGFRKMYVLGKSLLDFPIVLEGPNDKEQIISMKKGVRRLVGKGHLLIDGSIDRQFAAHPDIADEVYFALLVSKRKEQAQKALDLLLALAIPACSHSISSFLKENITGKTRSLLFNEGQKLLYHGDSIPFGDNDLKEALISQKMEKNFLYLNGALSGSFYAFLSPMRNLAVILDNFTLYQNVSVRRSMNRIFRPKLRLYHPAGVKKIFVKQETDRLPEFPVNIPVHNLYRDNPYEIGI